MKISRFAAFFFLVLALSSVVAPKTLFADEIVVSNTDPNCSTSSTPPCYTTIGSAVNAAITTSLSSSTGSYTVTVLPGTYSSETVTLNGVTVTGRETARTKISGSTVFATAGSSRISNLLFTGNTTGISVSGTAILTIENNIFSGNTTGINVQAAGSTIHNNVFYNNSAAAISSNSDIEIKNNIFQGNAAALSFTGLTTANNTTYNDFSSNTTPTNIPTSPTGNIITDPLFVNISSDPPDFHLQTGSPCIGTGDPGIQNTPFGVTTGSDMGAYGGPYSDTIPGIVTVVTATPSTTDTSSIDVTWTPTTDYQVTGYNVYYGTTSGVYGTPILVSGMTATAATISGLTATVSGVLSAPTVTIVSVGNGTLNVAWTDVSGATGYTLYYDISSPPTSATTSSVISNITGTSYSITGLTNGTTYYVAVKAVASSIYYVAVTALYSSSSYSPGVQYESAYSTETSASLGGSVESDLSTSVSDFPEALVAYPNLPSKQGCFIATAAYGYYSAPQVQVLRIFRDRFLATNDAGRAFIQWYYTHGPAAAAWLEAHPSWKPVVRAALLPAIGMALVLTKTPLAVLIVMLLSLVVLSTAMFLRRFGFGRIR